jgi:hypothetical protein
VRDLFDEPAVSDAVDSAILRWSRAHDAWEAITWSIARDPDDGSVALSEDGRTRLMVSEGARSIDWPTIAVVYRYDGIDVTFLDARFSDAKSPQSGRA